MKIENKVPPQECVPWFEENFKVGDNVSFLYNGGMGGIYKIGGTISNIDLPEIYLEEAPFSYTIGYIERITRDSNI